MIAACKEYFSAQSEQEGGEDTDEPTPGGILEQAERELEQELTRHDRLIHELGSTLDKMLDSDTPGQDDSGEDQGPNE